MTSTFSIPDPAGANPVRSMLIRLLETATQDGFVFRVDMRLRPFGASGPLVASFSSFEDYLQGHGRDWERYAWIKARPITAAERYAEIYASAVRPFVYRRYLDFGVFQSLREMKALIEREVERRELADDIKLGPGAFARSSSSCRRSSSSGAGRTRGCRRHRCSQLCPGSPAASCCRPPRWPISAPRTISCAVWRIGCRC